MIIDRLVWVLIVSVGLAWGLFVGLGSRVLCFKAGKLVIVSAGFFVCFGYAFF